MKNTATITEKAMERPMECRMRLTSRAPQNWLKKIAPPVHVPKLKRLNIKVTRLACVTAEYAASPSPDTISPSMMCSEAATSC